MVPDSLRKSLSSELIVGLRLEIDSSGRVARVVRLGEYAGTSRYLANLAEAAARNWSFTPALRDGQPVASQYEVQFRFVR